MSSKKWFLIFLIYIVCVSAEDHYITQNGDASSHPVSWFNNADNWNSAVAEDGKIGPGDTVYFSGTFTEDITIQGSGTAANMITLDGLESGDGDPLSSASREQMATFSRAKIILDKDYIAIQDFVFENNKESVDGEPSHKFVGLKITRNYIEISTSYQTALALSFITDSEISHNYAHLPNMPSYPDCAQMGRFVRFSGASRNKISHNTIKGGMTAIIFLHGLNYGSLPGPISIPSRDHYTYDPDFNFMDNEISYNNILEHCEEGISYDIAALSSLSTIIDRDTVSSIDGSKVTLSHSGWNGAGNKWSGAYMISLAERDDAFAQHALIEEQYDSVFTLSSELANLQVGDQVSIAFVFKNNWIHHNTFAPDSKGFGWSSVLTYGPALTNLIEDNSFGTEGSKQRGIKIHGNTGFFVSDFGVTGTTGSAPAAFNIVRNNDVTYLADFVYDFHGVRKPLYYYNQRNNAIYDNDMNGENLRLHRTNVYTTEPYEGTYYTILDNDPTGFVAEYFEIQDDPCKEYVYSEGWCAECGPCAIGQGMCADDDECEGNLVCIEDVCSIAPIESGAAPIIYYDMDAIDCSSGCTVFENNSGYDAFVHGNPEVVAGRVGNAIHFDGVDDYLETGFLGHLPNWTVSVWTKGDALPSGSKDAGPIMKEENFILSWDHGSSSFRNGIGLRVAGKWYPATFGEVEADRWYHFAASYDGENLRAFKDGLLHTVNTQPSGPSDASTYPMTIGKHSVVDEFFSGSVDEVMVWNRVLSEEEIIKLYNCVNIGELIMIINDWIENKVSMEEVLQSVLDWKSCS